MLWRGHCQCDPDMYTQLYNFLLVLQKSAHTCYIFSFVIIASLEGGCRGILSSSSICVFGCFKKTQGVHKPVKDLLESFGCWFCVVISGRPPLWEVDLIWEAFLLPYNFKPEVKSPEQEEQAHQRSQSYSTASTVGCSSAQLASF